MKVVIQNLLVLFILLCGCKEKKIDKQAEGEKIMQLSKEWSTAAAEGDIEKTVSYWADDATLISPFDSPLKGKDAIRQMVEQGFKAPGFKISWQPESVHLSESGDMAYTIEDSQMSYTDSTGKQISQNNKVVRIWRKQADGSWKNVVDISTPK